jgi:group II intron reverse transcriptase/maturase
MIFEEKAKSIPITKEMVWAAYKKIRQNGKGAGVDQMSLGDFEKVRNKELYKIWNRLSSGSYFPPMVKRVLIPKGEGKQRPLGIPTVGDRIAQEVLRAYLEPRLEDEFLEYSYGYRPARSGHDAVEEVRQNVRKYPWVIDLDIQEFFENVDHDLLMKALERHVKEKWVLMYLKRWLESAILLEDGSHRYPSGKGTPQGGVISPLLSNLYLHYSIDKWLMKFHPKVPMVRYADDVVIHCRSYTESQEVLSSLKHRLEACKLTAHPEKTKIVYCKKSGRNLKGHPVQFDFLGFSFQPLQIPLKRGGSFQQFDCKMSRKSKKRILGTLRELAFHKKSQSTIQDLALMLNPKIRGWINYYGKVSKKSLTPVFYHLHHRIIKWILNKYKGFKGSKIKAVKWLRRIIISFPNLFYHWQLGYKFVRT